jgi:hypothetical protein
MLGDPVGGEHKWSKLTRQLEKRQFLKEKELTTSISPCNFIFVL